MPSHVRPNHKKFSAPVGAVGFLLSLFADVLWAFLIIAEHCAGLDGHDYLVQGLALATIAAILGTTLSIIGMRNEGTATARFGIVLGVLGIVVAYPCVGQMILHFRMR